MKISGFAAPYARWRGPVWLKLTQRIADVLILIVAFRAAYQLRFDFDEPPVEFARSLLQMPLVVVLQIFGLRLSGAQASIWRYIGMIEVRNFVWAAMMSSLPLLVLRLTLPDVIGDFRVPLSIIVMDTLMAFMGLVGVRVLRRTLYERRDRRRRARITAVGTSRRILLIGAGRAGQISAREIQSRGDAELQIMGFVDDDPHKLDSVIQGVRVIGTTADLPQLASELKIDQVLISIAATSRRDLKRILSICEAISLKVRIIPALNEIIEGKLSVSRMRDVQVEDLIGRAQVRLEEDAIAQLLANRTVMVTGAGGSIGSELVRQAGRFNPASLLLVERAEGALFEIDRQIRDIYPRLDVNPLVGDVGDVDRMQSLLETYRPQVILHAAAHKHVPMMEHNPAEAIKNNALATHALAELAGEYGTEVFVLISTDKAVRPKSVMGASKRVAELAVQALGTRFATRYVIVRFGNVIGSAGSVVPIFRDQIRKGGPVTVTHPEMTRYFMTIPEAAQLVLQAAVIGESGEILILDMGEPVRILDLAKDTIRLSGFKPFEDIQIVYSGLRPGEKLVEELETTGEGISRTRHQQIFIGNVAGLSAASVQQALGELSVLARSDNELALRRYLNELLPEAQLQTADLTAAGPRITAVS